MHPITSALLSWYDLNARTLPWRGIHDPYRTWVSEAMLQQTRVETVLSYYDRFLARFPDLPSLAAADEADVLKLWEGLGYYSRARNLKKAAQLLVERWGGRLPEIAAELKKLPGIGDYTAGAIASIAYGQREPAVDGNVLRVLARILESPEDVMQPAIRRHMAEMLRAEYPAGEAAGLLTEGIMELGETLCIPNGEPRCELCPVRECCRACRNGTAARYPVKSPPRERRLEERTVLLLRCGGKVAIRRRENKGLLAGLWEFPNLEGFRGEDEIAEELTRRGARLLACVPCGEARHVFTHVEWHMRNYLVDCAAEWGDFVWLSPGEIAADYSIPVAFRAVRKRMEELP